MDSDPGVQVNRVYNAARFELRRSASYPCEG